MRSNRFNCRVQSGKVTVVVKGNGATGIHLKHSDTTYYQVGSHGDYVQEAH